MQDCQATSRRKGSGGWESSWLAWLHGDAPLVVIMAGPDFFVASLAIGVGGTGWTLQGEVFPTAVRGRPGQRTGLAS